MRASSARSLDRRGSAKQALRCRVFPAALETCSKQSPPRPVGRGGFCVFGSTVLGLPVTKDAEQIVQHSARAKQVVQQRLRETEIGEIDDSAIDEVVEMEASVADVLAKKRVEEAVFRPTSLLSTSPSPAPTRLLRSRSRLITPLAV